MKSTLSSLRGVNILGKEQQKSIKGGTGSCAVYLPDNVKLNPGTKFDSTSAYWSAGATTFYGVSKAMAGSMTTNGGK